LSAPASKLAAIGRRGEITVTAENRALVRRWFVTQGLPGCHQSSDSGDAARAGVFMIAQRGRLDVGNALKVAAVPELGEPHGPRELL
jgi:hypothetical protein